MLKKITFLPLLALGLTAVAPPLVSAKDRRGEQNEARAQMMAGKVKSIRSIESQILPRMAGSEYIGPEFDPNALVYRLKFIREGRVVFVDVDGRTGAILRQTR
jgi:uncharacterized membrane protein YkoI